MTDSQNSSTGKKTAGAFDIRVIIAMLIGLYGVVLVVTGLFATSDADLDKADGFNINLWAGLGMVIVAAAFVVWSRVRPIVVEDPHLREERRSG
jgi:drug/metabolite transporter (DMT)-like permease